MASSSWTVEGSLTKNMSESQPGSPKKWLRRSVSVYKGKNKETDEPMFDYVSFFVKPQDIDTFKAMPAKTKIRLTGRPEANSYVNKNGETIVSLQLNPAWEDWYEILSEPQPEQLEYSDEPF